MSDHFKISKFKTYWWKQEVDSMKREAEETRPLVEKMLDELKVEQWARLQRINASGPWDDEWAAENRRLQERAYHGLVRMKKFHYLMEKIRMIETQLPPRTGWYVLCYVNPWYYVAANSVVAGCVWGYVLWNW